MKKTEKTKKLLFTAIALLLIAGIVIGVWLLFFNNSQASSEAVYREYTVEQGDLTVGLSETGTVSLSRESISLPIATDIESVNIVTGSTVKQGDVLVQLSVESIEEGLQSYDLQLQSALLALENAKLEEQSGLAEAKLTYELEKVKGNYASTQSGLTDAQLENELTSAQLTLQTKQKELQKYTALSETCSDDTAHLNKLKAWQDDAAQSLADYKAQLTTFNSQTSETLSDASGLKSKLTQTKEAYESAQADYNYFATVAAAAQQAYDEAAANGTQVQEAQAALEVAQKSLSTAQQSVNKAQYNYNLALSNYNNVAYTQSSLEGVQTDIEQKIDELQAQCNNFSSAYQDYLKTYNDTYPLTGDALETKVETLKLEVANAEFSLEKSQKTSDMTLAEANVDKQSALNSASSAQEKYDLKAQSLAQNVQTQQLSYDLLLEQVNELKADIALDGKILAPCDGTVLSINAEAGDNIAADTPIVVISDASEVYMSISVSEEDITSVSVGQTANVVLSAYEDQTFDAVVQSITAEPARSGSASVSFVVTVKLSGIEGLTIYEGMSGDVTLIQEQAKDVLYISAQAISTQGEKSFALIKAKDGSIKSVDVTTGFTDGRYIEIVSGLSLSDTVLVESAVGVSPRSSQTNSETQGQSTTGAPAIENMPVIGEMPNNGEMPATSGAKQ